MTIQIATTTTTTTATTVLENWDWADRQLENSDFAEFEVDDCEFEPTTGEHKYFSDNGSMVTVDAGGNVIAGMAE